mgnify:CR=1 FL=1
MIDYSQFNDDNLQVSREIHLSGITELNAQIDAFVAARDMRREQLSLIDAELEARKAAST